MSGDKARTHKKQHFVPRSYLKAWCDPRAPEHYEPYVWRIRIDGSAAIKKSPENLFAETDTYTITLPDGSRDLRLEMGLATLEDRFCRVRDEKLRARAPLSLDERVVLSAFIAAMKNRVPAMREHQRKQWGQILEVAERMQEWAQTASPSERRALSSASTGKGTPIDIERLRETVEHPLQNIMPLLINATVPLLLPLDLLVLEAGCEPGFITSDDPCVWFDPEAYKRPPFYRSPGLAYPSIEITLPVSPTQIICLNRRGVNGYTEVSERAVDELNRRTLAHANEYVVSKSDTKKDVWFELGEEPNDSWEKVHGNKDKGADEPPPASRIGHARSGSLTPKWSMKGLSVCCPHSIGHACRRSSPNRPRGERHCSRAIPLDPPRRLVPAPYAPRLDR